MRKNSNITKITFKSVDITTLVKMLNVKILRNKTINNFLKNCDIFNGIPIDAIKLPGTICHIKTY